MNNSKKARIRQGKIRDMLQKQDVVKLQQFCSELNASIATIRNDLTLLEKQGVLKRVLGGAISCEGTPRNTGYHARITVLKKEKMAIAKYVVQTYVKEGVVVCLDAGSTNHFIAQEILNQDITCTVITNSFNVAGVLAKANKVTLLCAGGQLNREQNAYYDEVAVASVSGYKSDVYFISPNGLSIKAGITNSAKQEGIIKKVFAKNAQKIIVVADYLKFDKVADELLLSYHDVEEVISDKNLSKDIVKKYLKYVKVTQV